MGKRLHVGSGRCSTPTSWGGAVEVRRRYLRSYLLPTSQGAPFFFNLSREVRSLVTSGSGSPFMRCRMKDSHQSAHAVHPSSVSEDASCSIVHHATFSWRSQRCSSHSSLLTLNPGLWTRLVKREAPMPFAAMISRVFRAWRHAGAFIGSSIRWRCQTSSAPTDSCSSHRLTSSPPKHRQSAKQL